MADNSNISWTDHTFNPWMGCQEWSEGCRNCYAKTLTTNRMGLDVFGNKELRQLTKGPWKTVARLHRQAEHDARTGEGLGRPHRVFCASLADVFEDAPGPNEWRPDVWDLIRSCPWFDWQLLTKRPDNIAAMLPDDWGAGWPNVWLGTSIEDRRVVDRAAVLGEIPAFNRFISYEPAIGPVIPEVVSIAFDPGVEDKSEIVTTWQDDYTGPGLRFYNESGELAFHWLIAGGESGSGYRPMELEWALDARQSCEHEGVAFFFKQISAFKPGQGEDALGRVEHNFPRSWDRADLADHPVFAEAVAR